MFFSSGIHLEEWGEQDSAWRGRVDDQSREGEDRGSF